jgi:hypothetical protein
MTPRLKTQTVEFAGASAIGPAQVLTGPAMWVGDRELRVAHGGAVDIRPLTAAAVMIVDTNVIAC